MGNLLHIAEKVLNRPLMILPEKLTMISHVLDGRIGIDASGFGPVDDDSLIAASDASRFAGRFEQGGSADINSRKAFKQSGNVAIVPVIGSLVNRGGWLNAASGITSYDAIKRQLLDAEKDPMVKAILLEIDSPGGEATGAFETADVVRQVAASKDVVAVVNGMAASAAYAIASGARRIVVGPSMVVGSIGVVLLQMDHSHALHQRGIKPTLIHAGARKIDGNPYQPLTDDVKAELKAEVDTFYKMFVQSVAKGRKGRMTEKAARATEARTYVGAQAVGVGLADAVGTIEGVFELLTSAPGALGAGRRPEQSQLFQAALDLGAAKDAEAARVTQILLAGNELGLDATARKLVQMPVATITAEAAISFMRQLKEDEKNAPMRGLRSRDVSFGLVVDRVDGPASTGSNNHGWSGIAEALNEERGR